MDLFTEWLINCVSGAVPVGIEEGWESCTFLKSIGHIFSKNSFGHYNAILSLAMHVYNIHIKGR